MTKYVALLRGIAPMNPNMRNEKLRGVLEDLGFTNVKSIISSGNLTFESSETNSAKLEAKIQDAWPQKLDFTSTTIVRSLAEIKKLVDSDPFKSYTHGPKTSLNVTFLKQPSSEKLADGAGYKILHQSDHEVCSVVDATSSKTSNYMVKAEKALGKQITTRTWKTVERILKALS